MVWPRFSKSLLVCFFSLVSVALPGGAQADDEGFESLFDGKTLDGWDGDPKFWSVQDGAITGKTTESNPTKGNTFCIWRKGDVSDFELRLDFKIVGGNSGIQYRSEEPEKWVIKGYQADFDAGNTFSGILYEERGRGILAMRGKKVVIGADGKKEDTGEVSKEADIIAKIKKEDWNSYRVIAKGNHLIHEINGITTVDVTDHEEAKRAKKGLLALQLHAGPPMTVQFRNIKIKKLTDGGAGAKKKVVFVAGVASHGYGAHEHYAGCRLLAKSLEEGMPNFQAVVIQNGWPADDRELDSADCIVMYCDGGDGHFANAHLDRLDALAKKGVGVVCVHYGVEVPKGKSGEKFLDWIGGYFETHWSVNPHWTASFEKFSSHAICNGVKPFKINDEWYYHMRFRPGMKGVTPILTALPPKDTLTRPDGPHSGNPDVRAAIEKGEAQHVAWAAERADGGRGFGFTGGHDHWNWGDPNFRKIVLNAIVWCAKVEVPKSGVSDKPVSLEDLEANQDEPQPEKFNRDEIKKKLLSASASADPMRAPESAVSGLDVAEGLAATLFASEPHVLNLTNIDVDPKGRVWACEVMNYRKHLGTRPEGDRILILEDTDGDGTCDKTKVFYQGTDVDSAIGIGVFGNKVVVSCSPNILVFTDEDGDDKPDRKEILFSKTGQAQHDHSAHSFVFGPDGKFYWNFGNTGQRVCDAKGNVIVDVSGRDVFDNGKPYFGGMVFRCNSDGSEFEVLSHNFRNNYEVAVDSFGGLWQSDNDDDGNKAVRINYLLEHGNYGYRDEMTGAGWQEKRDNLEAEIPLRHWHLNDPGVVPNLLQTGAGSPTGILVYEGRLLPKVFWNQVIHCDAGPNIVRAYPVTTDGAGYKAEMVNILHGARDNWFRPADVCVAPDGSLFISDWYDPGVGGHAQGDLERGRVFRVAPPNAKYTIPKFDFSTAEGACEALKSPCGSVRYQAYMSLSKMGDNAANALQNMLKNASHEREQARALWLLSSLKGHSQKALDFAMGSSNANFRVMAVRMALSRRLDEMAVIRKLASDEAPSVRRQCAVALWNKRTQDVPDVWAELASRYDGKDRWYLEALGIGADGNWDACLAAWMRKVGPSWDQPAGRDIVWRSRSKQTPGLLVKILKSGSLTREEEPRFMRAFDFQADPEKDEALQSLIE